MVFEIPVESAAELKIHADQEFKSVIDSGGNITLVPKIQSIYDETKYDAGSLHQSSLVDKFI